MSAKYERRDAKKFAQQNKLHQHGRSSMTIFVAAIIRRGEAAQKKIDAENARKARRQTRKGT